MDFLELYWTDVYKTGHVFMLPPGSVRMVSNFTPRSGRLANFDSPVGVISAGTQMMVSKMKDDWDRNFFSRPIEEIDQFGKDMTDMLMLKEPFDVTHFKELHKLGYLPLEIRALPEGTLIPYKVPMYVVWNTESVGNVAFDFLVNYLETIFSAESWQAPTSATTAFEFVRRGRAAVLKTDPENEWFLKYKYHDFSMRGMGGKSAIVNSGVGFAMVSHGSDTLPVIPATRKWYGADKACINSVIATEHAIMCTLTGFFLRKNDGTWDKIGELEVETFRYLLRRFPIGILSLVSDTWDLWRVIIDYCVVLKDEILDRNGKLVIRPDSGDPVDILCGLNTNQKYMDNADGERFVDTTKPEYKGVIELLYEIFGGTITSTGYKKLHEKIGAIYGDSINILRADQIDERMMSKGFATTNYVLGVGSYSLQYVTRDTHGFAQKATYVEIDMGNGPEGIEIFKDPITDSGVKKSARGLIAVNLDENDGYVLKDQATWDDVLSDSNCMLPIFKDGSLMNSVDFDTIRGRVDDLLKRCND